jgi:hypothetical protein
MAAITRLRAVPGVFLWLVLCVPGPSLAPVAADATRDASFAVVLSAPLYPAPQMVRVKADPPSRAEAAAARPSTWLHRPTEASTPETTLAPDPPSVVLSCPPLAPRPPPLA